ncbi:MAG: YciI family protein [Planctomycetia bacterium]|nr:YciI family protein [Planctomycetia bacterium]
MKFVCLGFIDQAKFAELPPAEGLRMMEECFAYDDELRRGGHFLGGEALDSATKAVTLSMQAGNVQATDGPFTETKETLGGILLLEARDMHHAIALMSKHPGVKMGPFEIRPANEAINHLVAARSATFAKDAP